MKILIIQDRLRSGGTERQSILLANAFATSGHETTLLTFRPGGALDAAVAPRFARCVLQPFDIGLDWFAPRLYRTVAASRPDVILCMGRMANCYAGGLQERFPTTAVIATMRTGKSLPRLFRRSLGIVRQIVANSHDAKINLETQHAIPPERIAVIHNSLIFSPAPAADGRAQLRATYGATTTTVVLLCVAMFRPEKNQRELIEIAAKLPAELDWQLWLGGDGPARASCERLTVEKSLGHRVKFLGWQRDPAPYYTAADLAVHASWSEALSNFLIEAQASGLPAVAYHAQGIAECFLPGDTGFVIARDDRAAFCSKLVELAQADASAKTARAERARAYARNAFDHDRQVAHYLELFERLRATTPSGTRSGAY
jgi:glycosyltransferase involved in cell wall biosynthesis